MLDNQDEKSEYLTLKVNLSFTTELWRKQILKNVDNQVLVARRYFEICVFSHLAEYLHSGDIFVHGAESYSDYRKELLTWESCATLLDDYCNKVDIPNNANGFVDHLKNNLINISNRIDREYPEVDEFIIDENGTPMLKKRVAKQKPLVPFGCLIKSKKECLNVILSIFYVVPIIILGGLMYSGLLLVVIRRLIMRLNGISIQTSLMALEWGQHRQHNILEQKWKLLLTCYHGLIVAMLRQKCSILRVSS